MAPKKGQPHRRRIQYVCKLTSVRSEGPDPRGGESSSKTKLICSYESLRIANKTFALHRHNERAARTTSSRGDRNVGSYLALSFLQNALHVNQLNEQLQRRDVSGRDKRVTTTLIHAYGEKESGHNRTYQSEGQRAADLQGKRDVQAFTRMAQRVEESLHE
jgi:hypothetical protein